MGLKLGRDSISLSFLNNGFGHFHSSGLSFGVGDHSSCSKLFGFLFDFKSHATRSSFDLEGVENFSEVRRLFDRDHQEERLFGRNFGDGGVGPLDQEVGNLDDFRVASLSNTLQVNNLVLLCQDVLQQVDIG